MKCQIVEVNQETCYLKGKSTLLQRTLDAPPKCENRLQEPVGVNPVEVRVLSWALRVRRRSLATARARRGRLRVQGGRLFRSVHRLLRRSRRLGPPLITHRLQPAAAGAAGRSVSGRASGREREQVAAGVSRPGRCAHQPLLLGAVAGGTVRGLVTADQGFKDFAAILAAEFKERHGSRRPGRGWEADELLREGKLEQIALPCVRVERCLDCRGRESARQIANTDLQSALIVDRRFGHPR